MSQRNVKQRPRGSRSHVSGGAFPPPGGATGPASGAYRWVLLGGVVLLLIVGLMWRGQRRDTDPATNVQAAEPMGHVAAEQPREAPPTLRPLTQPQPEHHLDYVELVTAGRDHEAALPVVIAVHGLGDTPEGFLRLFEGISTPLRIIAPRAPTPYHNGHTWFGTTIAGGRVVELDVPAMAQSAQRLAWLARDLSARWPTVGKPVITGFSQGGILAFLVSANHPAAVKAAIPVSGLWPSELRQSIVTRPAGLPVVVALHGENDQLVEYQQAVSSIARLQELGYAATLESFPGVAHGIAPAMRQRLHRLLSEL